MPAVTNADAIWKSDDLIAFVCTELLLAGSQGGRSAIGRERQPSRRTNATSRLKADLQKYEEILAMRN